MSSSTPAGRVDASLRVFGDPSSVAVVGASADPAKWGFWLSRGALRGRHRRDVSLVNARGGRVLGQSCAASLAALPAVPELVALCVPAPRLPAVVDEALALGVRGVLAIATGVADEAGLADRVRTGGARLIGPNSLGIVDTAGELQLAWGHFTAGPLAVVSQSGQVGSEIASLAARAGVGGLALPVHRELGRRHGGRAARGPGPAPADPGRRSVPGELRRRPGAGGGDAASPGSGQAHRGPDGRGQRRRTAGRPLPHGVDDLVAGRRRRRLPRCGRGAGRHTGAAGGARAAAPRGSAPRRPAGRRGGGQRRPGGHRRGPRGGAPAGGAVPPHELQRALADQLPPAACTSNPVDLAGAGEADLGSYADVVERLLRADDVDAVVLTGYFGCYGEDTPTLAERELEVVSRLAGLADAAQRPLVVHTMSPDSPAAAALWAQGVPAYGTIDAAVGALARACTLADHPGHHRSAGADEDPPGPQAGGYWAARELLRGTGVAFPAATRVRSPAELATAASVVPGPYVLKAGWLEHKSERGGVLVGIAGEQLEAAFLAMHARLGDGDYVLEQQDLRADAVEVLVGARQDPHLGAVVVVGAGGLHAELHRDLVVELAPVDDTTALAMVRRLRCLPLLEGWRGRPATDLPALVEVIVSVSRLAARRPDLAEIELNPVRVAPQGALAVDVLVVPGADVDARRPAADR
jgi:acyl-CoA synthetase (NDP forming)